MSTISINLLFGGIGFIAVIIFIILLHRRITLLTRGRDRLSLEEIIKENNKLIHTQEQAIAQFEKRISFLENEDLKNIKNVKVLRFNPYKETGGNQSFALSLLNKNKDGIIISSLYSREYLHLFAKPIKNGTSEYTLSKEEQEVL